MKCYVNAVCYDHLNCLQCQLCQNGDEQIFPIKADIQKATQCAICLEMFLENFDYNKVSNSDQHINSIKQVLTRFGRSSEEVGTINRDSVEFISQEISMHYFLNEAESQFTGKVDSDFSKCKSKMPLEDLNCDKQRLNLCDSILTYDAGTCGSNLNTPPQSSYISSPSISPPIRRGFDLTQNYPQLRNPAMQNIFSNSGPNIKTELDQIKNQYQIPQISTNMLNSFQGLNQPRFRQESYNSETSLKGPDVEGFNRVGGLSTHSDASPIGFSPSYTRQNFASAPKSHWSPPKPVLLDNFQADIGNQLKDINSLAK